MPTKIDRAQINHVASLAALSLTDAEANKLTDEMGSILRYVDELAELDTTDVPPTAHVQLERTAFRQDVVLPGVTHEEALGGASRTAEDGFAVPGFVDSEG
jgi:aspartyl-tRNA(Asn)/glutamyl-tRNA(Gln) amidotransferase subunit C